MNKTVKMNHGRWRNSLTEYLEGSLPEEEMRQISLHLKECPSCREFAEYLSESLSVLETMKIIEPDPFFYTRLSGRLRPEEEHVRVKFRLVRVLQPALISLVILAAVFAGIELGGMGRLKDTDRYAMYYLDPWLNEMKSEPLEMFLTEN